MRLCVIFFCLILFSLEVNATCLVVDDTGQKIKLNLPAQRIVSLAPDLTELLFEVGAGKHIVGVMRESNYPPAAKKIPIVASYNSVDSEKILALKPDLIIVWAEGNLAQPLKKFGIPIYFSHQKKLTDIPYTLERFGCLTGEEKTAQRDKDQFLEHYQTLHKAYSEKKVVSVFYQVGSQPLMTITKNSWINDVITLCGGKNIFADLKGAAPVVNLESIITANPDVIIGSSSRYNLEKFWTKWSKMSAVQKNHFISIDPDLIERASSRLLKGADKMCQAFDSAR